MSLPWRPAVGCVVHVRRSNSLCGTDESHGQRPSRACPTIVSVLSCGRPTASGCGCGVIVPLWQRGGGPPGSVVAWVLIGVELSVNLGG